MNDIAINKSLFEKAILLGNYQSSLVRFSEAHYALKYARYIINDEEYNETPSFEFENTSKNGTSCKFEFETNAPLKPRINIIIGVNGSGKTTYLSDLALTLSGNRSSGKFISPRPAFNKIITVSFSIFDNFSIPENSIYFSYKYCGLRDNGGFVSKDKMIQTYIECRDKIRSKNEIHIWSDILGELFDEEKLNTIYELLFKNDDIPKLVKGNKLSSGESILLYSFTQIISEATRDSIILFDEPELHLHPQAISDIIPALNILLKEMNCYSIIATHSPIILQQIPSQYIKVFDNSSGQLIARPLDIETLGENLNSINLEVFKIINKESEYKKILKRLSRKYSKNEIEKIFRNNLSLNAKIYLESLFSNEE